MTSYNDPTRQLTIFLLSTASLPFVVNATVWLYCRGLTRAIYILCIEHLRMLHLCRESNPGPPALQASTLCKEPFEQPYLVAIWDLTSAATAPPQVAMGDRG
jgi:hypothetical protein